MMVICGKLSSTCNFPKCLYQITLPSATSDTFERSTSLSTLDIVSPSNFRHGVILVTSGGQGLPIDIWFLDFIPLSLEEPGPQISHCPFLLPQCQKKLKDPSLPPSYALELLTVYAWEQGCGAEAFDIVEGIKTVLELITQWKHLCVYWTVNYNFEDETVRNIILGQIRSPRYQASHGPLSLLLHLHARLYPLRRGLSSVRGWTRRRPAAVRREGKEVCLRERDLTNASHVPKRRHILSPRRTLEKRFPLKWEGPKREERSARRDHFIISLIEHLSGRGHRTREA